MSQKMQIGLLSPFFQPIPGYEESAQDLDLGLVIVTPRRIDWKNQAVHGLVYNGQAWEEESVPLPPSLYNRYYGPKPKVVTRLETVLGKNKVFNHVTRFDKWMIHQLLGESSLKKNLPKTSLYTPQSLLDGLRRFKTVVLKSAHGQLGAKIYLVVSEGGMVFLHQGTLSPVASFSTNEELLRHLEPLIGPDFLVQRYIPLALIDGRAFDLRFLLQKDGSGQWNVSGVLSRLAMRHSYITNVCQAILPGEDALRMAFTGQNIMPELIDLSIKAARIVEGSLGSLGELSVDFGLDSKGGVWIIELNAKPMKHMFADLGNQKLVREIYGRPLLYALHLATT
ncbi:MAG: YheC/YheD family protein [Limnochordia bacterium]|jgi:glutathione synthase/RimK-type ligase-like ATP-grasp enzyme|nr:YheC/YheD family protein [Limnochordia bacterium]